MAPKLSQQTNQQAFNFKDNADEAMETGDAKSLIKPPRIALSPRQVFSFNFYFSPRYSKLFCHSNKNKSYFS